MAGDVTKGFLKRLSYIDGRPGDYEGGSLIAGQEYYDVYFTGGYAQNLTLEDATLIDPVFQTPVPLISGGTGQALVAPVSDRIVFYDASESKVDWLVPGSGLIITGNTLTVAGVGLGDVTGPAGATDNRIARFDGATGKVIQSSGATIDDSGNITATNLSGTNTGDQTITLTGAVTGSGTGSFATTLAANIVGNTNLRDSTALTVIGRSANSTGDPADIAAGSDHQVLRRSGTTLGFGSINLAQSAAVTGVLDETNGGTGLSSFTTGDIVYASGSNTLAKLPIGTTGQFLTVSGGIPAWGSSSQQVLHVQDQKTSGTNGGTAVGGSTYAARTLNTVVTNTITGSSLVSNQITLPAGTYNIQASVPAFRVDSFKSNLQNITDGAITLNGTNEYSANGGSHAQTRSFITGEFTIAAPKVFEVQFASVQNFSTNGLGVASGLGTEIYTDVRITKL